MLDNQQQCEFEKMMQQSAAICIKRGFYSAPHIPLSPKQDQEFTILMKTLVAQKHSPTSSARTSPAPK